MPGGWVFTPVKGLSILFVKRVFGNVRKRMRTLTPPVAASRGQVKVRKCPRH
ncbi:hypothetical protein BT96DRAFT_924447 [Gymnopus androsaceus JB14]|uniref:Uncharacterized protein n=1 Tax=Gymnopus androsaceus JB14 TaxID=1447944 RepID=A0A6A4H584_9AGAR|nr:hypothetical protein BT96DRAFT_924447 [Gymnopus androsaceus JB14]